MLTGQAGAEAIQVYMRLGNSGPFNAVAVARAVRSRVPAPVFYSAASAAL